MTAARTESPYDFSEDIRESYPLKNASIQLTCSRLQTGRINLKVLPIGSHTAPLQFYKLLLWSINKGNKKRILSRCLSVYQYASILGCLSHPLLALSETPFSHQPRAIYAEFSFPRRASWPTLERKHCHCDF